MGWIGTDEIPRLRRVGPHSNRNVTDGLAGQVGFSNHRSGRTARVPTPIGLTGLDRKQAGRIYTDGM